jgi:hypothetical protein
MADSNILDFQVPEGDIEAAIEYLKQVPTMVETVARRALPRIGNEILIRIRRDGPRSAHHRGPAKHPRVRPDNWRSDVVHAIDTIKVSTVRLDKTTGSPYVVVGRAAATTVRASTSSFLSTARPAIRTGASPFYARPAGGNAGHRAGHLRGGDEPAAAGGEADVINALVAARDLLRPILPAEINHFDRKAPVYAVLSQVDQWFGRGDNRSTAQYDVIQVDVWARDAPDFTTDALVRRALDAAGFKLARTGGDMDENGGVILHRISHDYQYDQEFEEV